MNYEAWNRVVIVEMKKGWCERVLRLKYEGLVSKMGIKDKIKYENSKCVMENCYAIRQNGKTIT